MLQASRGVLVSATRAQPQDQLSMGDGVCPPRPRPRAEAARDSRASAHQRGRFLCLDFRPESLLLIF